MYQEHHHVVNIIDFENTNDNTTFVKVTGFDAENRKKFEGVLKFVGGMPFGDLIHPQRSSLSPECRALVQSYVLNKYHAGDFN